MKPFLFCAILLVALVYGSSAATKGAIEGTGHTIGYGELEEEWRGEVIHLSWSPRAFYLQKFLTEEECDHIMKKAKPRLEKSQVVDSSTGGSVPSEARTSSGTFLSKREDDVIARIEKRVAQVTMIPVENQENLQVLKYIDGQKYVPHYDYFHDATNARVEMGGQRVLTVLMYLTTPDDGGETVFPNAEGSIQNEGDHWSPCARKGLAVKAVRGDAVMFYSLKPDGSLDPSSLHESCPALAGEKWSATKWIRVGPIG